MGKGIVKLGDSKWATKDGNLLAYKETNNRFTNTEFTFARGTDATYVGEDGLIKQFSSTLDNEVDNGDFSELGSNLITNGDFETPVSVSEWTNFTSPTTAERTTEKAYTGSYSYHIVGDGSNDGTQCAAGQFTGDYSIGDIVKITAYVYPITADSNQIKTGISNSGRGIFSTYSVTLNEWNKVEYYATITTASNNYITFLIAGTAGEFYLDDVSAQIVDPNGYWTAEGDWNIEDGSVSRTANAADTELKQTFTTTNTNTWKVSFEITERSAGGCGVRLNGGSVVTYYTTIGELCSSMGWRKLE